jgi:hypothetical protein
MDGNKRLIILVIVLIGLLAVYFMTGERGNANHSIQNRKRTDNPTIAFLESSKGLIKEIEKEPVSLNINWQNDPFHYMSPEYSLQSATNSGGLKNIISNITVPLGPRFVLKGIVWKNGVPTVLINDEVLQIGGVIDGYRVTDVGEKYVVIQSRNDRIELKLGD